MKKNIIKAGQLCRATGGSIRMITTKVCRYNYENNIKYTFMNYDNDRIELQNGHINFDEYVGKVCDIYGDFLPSKNTRTGKTKRKFLVVLIHEVRNVQSA